AAQPSTQSRPGSSLKVVTTKMTPGYLQKNGIPYSGNAVLTEYFTTVEDKGIRYLAITTMLEDPQYLTQSFVRTSQFKKLPAAARLLRPRPPRPRPRSISRVTGCPLLQRIGVIAWSRRRKEITPAFLSTMKGAASPIHGIRSKTKLPEMHAKPMERPALCACLGICALLGKTTIRCALILMPELSRAVSTSLDRSVRQKERLRGRVIPWLN